MMNKPKYSSGFSGSLRKTGKYIFKHWHSLAKLRFLDAHLKSGVKMSFEMRI